MTLKTVLVWGGVYSLIATAAIVALILFVAGKC